MTKFDQNFLPVLQDYKRRSPKEFPFMQSAYQYLESGDVSLLPDLLKLNNINTYYFSSISREMSSPDNLDIEDRRMLDILTFFPNKKYLQSYIEKWLEVEKPNVNTVEILLSEFCRLKLSEEEQIYILANCHIGFSRNKVNSFGKYILNLYDTDINKLYYFISNLNGYTSANIVSFLANVAPEKLENLAEYFINNIDERWLEDISHVLLNTNPQRYENLILNKFRSPVDKKVIEKKFDITKIFSYSNEPNNKVLTERIYDITKKCRLGIGKVLAQYNFEKYGDEVLQNIHEYLEYHIIFWMLPLYGKQIIPEIINYIKTDKATPDIINLTLNAVAKHLGKDGIPVYLSKLFFHPTEVCLNALTHLVNNSSGEHAFIIKETFIKLLPVAELEILEKAILLAGRWNPVELEEEIWSYTTNKSKKVRDAAARTLVNTGERAIPRAISLLNNKKADFRVTGVKILAGIDSPQAEALLEERLNIEENDEIRDQMLISLQAVWLARGRAFTREELDVNIERVKDKLRWPPASWIDENALPKLKYATGEELPSITRRYLLSRQSSVKEMVPSIELKPLYALIDRASSGDFALALWSHFISSGADTKDRWIMVVCGTLGDNRMVPVMNAQISKWVDTNRGKLAEYAVAALAMIGTDAALMTVDSLTMKYRSKMKNVGAAAVEAFNAAADACGMTPEELGDRVVPWLGFDAGYPRVAICGANTVEISVSMDFKLKYFDKAKQKTANSLPSTASKELKEECKELSVLLRDVAKAQILRHEVLMVRQYGWPAARWQELYLGHPVLRPFGVRLVWGAFDETGALASTFRALEDGSLTTCDDETCVLSDTMSIKIIHPLMLTEEEHNNWITSLEDYEITPPFPQMARSVVTPTPEQKDMLILKTYHGIEINGMTFRGRSEKLGWRRGSVCDAGGISHYMKSFPAAGIDAFLSMEGMYIGIDIYSDITLNDVFYVTHGSVKIGGYVYDEPADENDQRLIKFSEVPTIVFSEIMGDLQKITKGKTEEETAE